MIYKFDDIICNTIYSVPMNEKIPWNKLHKILGIYAIVCLTNKKIYIGSSNSVANRWRQHRGLLRKNKHANYHLQNAYNKYGENKFIFCLVETVDDINFINWREQLWLNLTASYDRNIGYNHCKQAGSTFGRPISNKVISTSSREYIITTPLGQEFLIKNLSKFCRENKLGLECLIGVAKGLCNQHKGWKCRYPSMNTEDWQNLRKSKIKGPVGRVGKFWKVTNPTGESYTIYSLRRFCKINGLNDNGMQRVAKGEYSQHKGWKCERL